MIEIKCPLEIQEQGKDQQYFETMYKGLQEYFGAENVLGAFIHRDEQHTYIGKDHKEYTSLYHAHCPVVAYTKEHGINGKHFETRARLHQLNDKLNELCLREFGIEMNTHGLAGKQSVEYLKQENQLHELGMQQEVMLDAQEKQIHEAAAIQQRIENKQEQEQSLDKSIERKNQQLDKLQGEVKNADELNKQIADKNWRGKPKDKITLSVSEYRNLQKSARRIDDVKGMEREYKGLIAEQKENTERSKVEREQAELERIKARQEREQADEYLRRQEDYIIGTADKLSKDKDDKIKKLQQEQERMKADYEQKLAEYARQDKIVCEVKSYTYEYKHKRYEYDVKLTVGDMRDVATGKTHLTTLLQKRQEIAEHNIRREYERTHDYDLGPSF